MKAGQFKLYAEATYTSLNDYRIPLLESDYVIPVEPGVLQFAIDDLNPGNYVLEISSFYYIKKGSRGGSGRTVSVQVTAGKQREYRLQEHPLVPAYPGRVVAEATLRRVIGMSYCNTPDESVYVNKRFPEHVEPFNLTADRVLNFELSFNDTVYVYVNDQLAAKKAMITNSSGLSGQMSLKIPPGAKISLRTTPNDCAEFKIQDGYKYLYINRYPIRKWDISYSNYSRAYY